MCGAPGCTSVHPLLGQLKCGKWPFLSDPADRERGQLQGWVNAAPFHSRPFPHAWWPQAGSRAHTEIGAPTGWRAGPVPPCALRALASCPTD